MAVQPSKFNITQNITNWNPQGSHVERLMDNAGYTSAHPDDTLVLVGPARFANVTNASVDLAPVGMLQQLSVQQQRGVQPTMTIGSGRMFMLPSKPQTSFSIARLFAKGRNIQRALLRGIKSIGDNDVSQMFNPAEPAHPTGNPGMVFNMDSELALIPFGMAVMFRDKAGHDLGSFYLEACMLNSFSVGLQAGTNMIMENVSGVCDRILPCTLGTDVIGDFFGAQDKSLNISTSNTDFTMNNEIV